MSKEHSGFEIDALVADLKSKLSEYGIPLDEWGVGKAKTLRHLAQEVLAGETVLVESGREILRRVEFVHIEVTYDNGQSKLRLVEEKQVFRDGRERRRNLTGVSEKMLPGENPTSAAARALREEIGVYDSHLSYQSSETETISSPSYPGLKTEYLKHEAESVIDESDFQPEGYIEEQDDKTTYFVWQRA